MDSETKNLIKELTEPIVQQEDMFLVDIEEKGADERVLWIYVDSEAGDVTVKACSAISRELSFVLDAHDLIRTSYRLNVSSPGLSRPLTDLRQYKKNLGRKLKVKYRSSDGYKKTEGVIKEVNDRQIVLGAEEDENRNILVEDIVEAKIIPAI